ncbi:metal-dependent hydrolase [Alicyclobacillus acidiphilus]|uniref:metal-dependent hydrolase n=1 Tax=Alicyclobacillus acidiphilus TaxID=182455 RepID=UPI000830381E|nr:metal-dependent hydrolase [Alicyclobacillus acidiphilus]
MKITFHGQSCFLIEHEEYRIIIDPFLSGNQQAVITPDDVKVSYVLLTHGHADHVLDAESIARANNATVIAPNELAHYYGLKGLQIHPLHIGGKHDFPFGRVKLTLAFHGSGMEIDNGFVYVGPPVGYLLTMGGKTIYHAGDTGLFGDMKLIGELNQIDLALLPIGDNFTMGPEDALLAAEWLRAKKVIPMHYNTFPLIAQDGAKFVNDLKARGLDGLELKIGESVEL